MVKYNSYKDSRIEWIDRIPSDWDIKRIGYISKLLTGNPWKSELFNFDEGIKIVRGENVSEGFLRWGDRTRYWKENVDKDSIFYLKDGDIVISMDGSKVGKNYVQIKEEDLPLLLHQRMCRVRVNETYDSRYVLYFIGSNMFKYYIDVSKTDPMVPHITQKNIYDFKLSIPTLPEQHQIVQYLDTKTTLIDNLIQKTQEKINLLREKRTSLINYTITKGLNPNVEMKVSGVEWIGEIPKHWEIKRIGYISKLLTGNPWKSELFDFDEGVKIVRGENVSEGFLRWGDRTRYWKENVDNDSIFYLKDGDIIISMDGSKVGKNYVQIKEEDLPLLLHQRMCRVRVNETYVSKYILYFIGCNIFKYYIDISKTDPMIPHITQRNIYDFKISVPSFSEQQQIIEYLDEQTQLIDNLILKEEKRVILLKEYRQTLISEVITGKIKVNG